MVTLKIITGSVRPGRFNIQPANWILERAKEKEGVTAELLDLKEINLPFLDEEKPPMMHQYSHEHTKKWADAIAETDGFIFVTPEYNHSLSPVLKNAIDYLYYEWNFKPVSFISYGSQAGGARVVEHLRNVAGELKMYDLREQLLLPNFWEGMDENGAFQFTEKHTEQADAILTELIFWSERMKEARSHL